MSNYHPSAPVKHVLGRYLMSLSHIVVFTILISTVLPLVSCNPSCKSESAVNNSVPSNMVSLTCYKNQSIIVSNKITGSGIIDLTRIGQSSVDYRWRFWGQGRSTEQRGENVSELTKMIKLDESLAVTRAHGFLLLGNMRLRWTSGSNDYIRVWYKPDVTTINILSDVEFENLNP